jgi:hypothetical protein
MKYGFVLPYGDARTAADMACEAEAAGWDGFFVWEPVWGIDAWVCLTPPDDHRRIRLGTMLTPPSRMRPGSSPARCHADNLSGGRVISLSPGRWDYWLAEFGEETDRKMRRAGGREPEILTGLWKGQPFSFKHYTSKSANLSRPARPAAAHPHLDCGRLPAPQIHAPRPKIRRPAAAAI